MYSHLALYYLNQIGIVPWIERSQDTSYTKDYVNKLLMLVPENRNNKAFILLNQLIKYLNVAEPQLQILHLSIVDSQSQHDEILSITGGKLPRVIWSLGVNQGLIPSDLSDIVVYSDSIEHLLNNPVAKKRMLHDLSIIKQMLLVVE